MLRLLRDLLPDFSIDTCHCPVTLQHHCSESSGVDRLGKSEAGCYPPSCSAGTASAHSALCAPLLPPASMAFAGSKKDQSRCPASLLCTLWPGPTPASVPATKYTEGLLDIVIDPFWSPQKPWKPGAGVGRRGQNAHWLCPLNMTEDSSPLRTCRDGRLQKIQNNDVEA